jgi:DNA-binding IclR family transcriptional regulator
VSEVADSAKLPPDQASLCLRALQARGLLHSSRVSRWVHYYPSPDPLVPQSAPILEGVSRAVFAGRVSDATLIRCLTAFTHPRRLTILRSLQRSGQMAFTELARAGRMSEAALFRHLKKLSARGVICEAEAKWALSAKPGALAETFLSLLARNPEE